MKITKKQLQEMVFECVQEVLSEDGRTPFDDPTPSPFGDEPPWQKVLDIAHRGSEGVGWTIPNDWANEIVEDFDLNLKTSAGDMSGEKSAIFTYMGDVLRLKFEFPNRWKIYKGPWKPDRRWTGD